ncbi:MAG: hypothetical protein GXY70_07995 [Euryarchaeota archaeon]|nr:hypothetical protein [Euryarchaeota archaeon]
MTPAPIAAPIRIPTSRNTMAIEPFDFLGSAAVPSIFNPPSSHSIHDWEIDFVKQFVAIYIFVDYPPEKWMSSTLEIGSYYHPKKAKFNPTKI